MAERIELDSEPSNGDGTDGRYLCPYCHDYQGKRASVQAHIRGKTDPVHKGKSGFENESEPEPSSGSSTDTEQDRDPTQNKTEKNRTEPATEDDDDTVTALISGGLILVLLWVINQAGIGDELADRMTQDNGKQNSTGPRNRFP